MSETKWTLLEPADLRAWRMTHAFTRKQLGVYFRVTPSAIRAYERGDVAPPEWLQDRMVATIVSETPPEITAPRGRRRRYRWSRLTGATIFLWRRAAGLKQSEAAEILGVNQTSVSRWERNQCAPPPDMQAALRARIDGYDTGTFPKPDPSWAPARPSTRKEDTVAAQDNTESVAKRAHALMEKVDSLKLPERTQECRWGKHDGFVVTRSSQTGAYYLWDAGDGQFFRTKHPRSTQIQSDSPRGVIHEDRQWLYSLLNKLPEGKVVVQRYHEGSPSPAPQTAQTAQTATAPQAVHPTQVAAMHGLVDLKPAVEKKEVIVVKNSGKLVVRVDHLLNLLKLAAIEIPTAATCDVEQVTFSWTLPDETIG